jgi:hypothetical protein
MRTFLTPPAKHFFCGVVIGATCIVLSGCSQLSAPASHPTTTVAATAPPDPNSFSWQTTSLSASGRGKAPNGTSAAQRTIVGQNVARVAALKDLKLRVRQLPVGTDQTVGSIMDNYIGVRRAIEKQIQQADVVSQQSIEGGEFEVQVQTPLQPIADILRSNYITPTEELPKPPSRGDELGVPAVS